MRNYEHIKNSLKLAHERLSGVYIFNEDFYNVEVIAYNRVLTDAERNLLHRELSNKYAITLAA